MLRFTSFAMAIAVTVVMARSVAAQEGGRAAVVIHLANCAHVRSDLLEQVKREVGRVLAAAGVDAEWIDESRPQPLGIRARLPKRLAVDILDDRMSESSNGRIVYDPDILGMAAREIDRAFVFFNRLTAAAGAYPADVTMALAHVMAHEIGHLLLPTNSHAASGVMRPSLDFRQLNFSRFTSAEAVAIRAGLAPRN
jgi:hypothetical protein